ncbi:S41 family peptidase [Streptomyces sp. HNM0663]|uniref:S41 family peptidase n=1 Tax=Streptomyces chengmaiensis TaxID=3040919 RepID=A0ABT6HXR5_9ACTN|nr:S41 family peptidase [Streptomyces chengmaiensis]MDH2393063.1 S41 family peptidase [Streptomyces chengmaiensis]
MPGQEFSIRPRRIGRGAVLSLVFAGVLATAAATNALPREEDPSPSRPSAARPSAPGPRDAVGHLDREEVARAAAEAMADGKSGVKAAEEVVSRSGDRWGAVYDKREYEEFAKALDGEYTGVGLWARRTRDGGIEIAKVRPGGPADKAGIRAGDQLLAVDGRPVAERPVTEVTALLRGGDRTSVALGLERDGRSWTETIRRARLTTQTVTVEQPPDADGIVMIKVSSFTKGSGERVREAVREAPENAGILLDLRGNQGGLVSEAVIAASAFLDGGLVATYDVHGEQRSLYAEAGGDVDRPLVVLIDGGTMSAAELLTGALRDRGRAVAVGSQTFGKGSVQMPSELPDGSVAELTVGHYRTPAGQSVDGQGITPDLSVTERAEDRARAVLSGLGGGS